MTRFSSLLGSGLVVAAGTRDEGRGTRGCYRSAGIGLRARTKSEAKREPGATCVRLYVSYGITARGDGGTPLPIANIPPSSSARLPRG